MHRAIGTLTILTAVAAAVAVATPASAQMRRQAPPGGEAPVPPAGGESRPRIPASAQFPFVGSWSGQQVVSGRAVPLGVDIQAASGKYSGATIWPNDARATHVNSRTVGDTLVWEQPNSGGGTWVYQANRQSADSLVGTVMLRGAPFAQTDPPSGKFVLVRMRPTS